MKNIAILYICTGSYVKLWQDFYVSFEKNFLESCNKEYFVFTDAAELYGERNNKRIHRIYQENLGWPGNTLFRFRIFDSVRDRLQSFDFVFFMNADIVCNEAVSEEMFLPSEGELLVVQHPGYFQKKPYEYAYDRNRKSSAYMSYLEGKVYVCGGVNGGSTSVFLHMVSVLKKRIDEDYSKGMIAKWHDESHINRYIWENSNYRILSPAFCYPEGWDLPFDPILIVRNKSRIIELDPDKVRRQIRKVHIWESAWKRLKNIWWKMVYCCLGR
ncbi:MAG: glycosyl transferase family 6 [Clostridiales bacterium]|mgnify:CR=1 FL=1|nr:glycosyl transferase family 6 [Clostridiales bacterium]